MLCQKCKQREANIHVSKVINGVKSDVYLCSECAQKENEMPTIGLHNMFDFNMGDFLSSLMPHGGYATPQSRTCPQCGMDLGEFKQRGRLGCPKCYNAFRAELAPLFRQVHGAQRHTGKMPGNVASSLRFRRQRESLQQKLEEAIRNERYEDAAQLRDEIRSLEAQEKEGK